MDKVSYFKAALRTATYMKKEWVLSIFTVIIDGLPKSNNIHHDLENTDGKDYPYRIYEVLDDPENIYYFDPNTPTTLKKLHGVSRSDPIYSSDERFDLVPGELPNVVQKVNTRYYTCIMNACLLVYPFGSKVPYMQKRMDGSLDDIIAKLCDLTEEATVAAGKTHVRDPNKIYVDELLRYHKAAQYIRGFTQICTPSVTAKSLIPSKAVRDLRDRLLEENKDKLNDPAVIVDIMQKVAAKDREELQGDASANFYIDSKSFNVTRMKVLYMYGLEYGFGDIDDKPVLFKKSLDEKLPLEDLPATIDSSRFGSYSRGTLTADGGARVKYAGRIFQNSRIIMEDCGSKHGITWNIHPTTAPQLVNRYRINEMNKAELITDEFLKLNMGKPIIVRTPQLCIAESPSYCEHCLDKYLALRPEGLYLAPMDVNSIFMNTRMKAMHGKQRSIVRLDIEVSFGY